MLMRGLRGIVPADVVVPITPMLDMSFQLLFFFICIYKPPVTEEAQFKLNLLTVRVPPSPPEPGGPENPFGPGNLPVNLTIDVSTHIGTGDRGLAEMLIEKVTVTGTFAQETRVELQKLGLLAAGKQDAIELTSSPAENGRAEVITPQSEEEVLKQLAVVLRAHRAGIPLESSQPVLTIQAPRELPLFKIIKLMDYGNENGFALELRGARR